jgi:hypothetical protein
LVPAAPEAMVAIALFVGGWLCLGWACIAQWFGRCAETAPLLATMVGRLLRLSLWGVLLSLMMMFVELAVA